MANAGEILHSWDVTDYLQTEDEIALFIEAALQDAPDDAGFMAKVMEEVARARQLNESRAAPNSTQYFNRRSLDGG